MKTILKILLFSIFIGMLAMSCEKKNNSFGLTNFSYSGCKNGTKTYATNNQTRNSQGDSETIEIKSKNGFLNIKHINAIFNCSTNNKLTADAAINDFTIDLNEDEDNHDANCLCLYDLNYKVGPVVHGKYTVKLNKMGVEYFRFSIDYNTSVDTIIFIKKIIL